MRTKNDGGFARKTFLGQLFGFIFLFAMAVASPAQQTSKQEPAKQQDSGRLPQDTGVLGLENMLRKLHTTARLLQTTAHPDDEDGGVLVYESRGKGAEVMLLTLTRGDGGQNKTGSNFFDELGVLRTLELLESDKYYGVEQRFSRVADFGFSKSATETLEKWGGKEIPLADMVRVIRTFRPDVVASRFQGAPRDGHGNHQAAGILTPEAVRAAADPNRFPEQIREGLLPWRVKKLYMNNVRAGEDYSVRFDVGQVFPPLGMTYQQFGIEGYSHQKSQNAGVYEVPPGPVYRPYKLIDSALPVLAAGTHENDFFDGIDTTLPGLADRMPSEPFDERPKRMKLHDALLKIEEKVSEATEAARSSPVRAAVPLLVGRRLTEQLIYEIQASPFSAAANIFLLDRLEEKADEFQDAANLALGLQLTAAMVSADRLKTVIPGETFKVLAKLHNPADAPIKVQNFTVTGWAAQSGARGGYTEGTDILHDFRLTVPLDAQYTRPYWHRNDPEKDNIFSLDSPVTSTFPPKVRVRVEVSYKFEGETGSISTTPKASFSDPRRDLAVVPPFSVLLQHAAHVIPATSHSPLEIKVEVQKNFIGAAKPAVRLNVPVGWHVNPESQPVDFSADGSSKSVSFTVTPGTLKEGNYELSAAVDYNGETYKEGFSVVSREDIDTFYYYQPATQRVSAVDVKVPTNLRVGYIMGAGDDIPTVLQQLGIGTKLLAPEEVAHADFSQFGTIILGIRAYDTREDVRKNNQRLLDYVSNGGTLIVQNNFSVDDFNTGKYTPYPVQLSRERVSVEEAPVEILEPADPLFRYPNAISAHDFDGWVQERGVNFMTTWDDHFQPLLASSDPGETPLKGGMLRARYGKGTYIYTGYAFFRQLPSGVPGAVRLYVDLVSAGHESQTK